MILNPWFWLGALLLLAGAAFTGYQQGSKHATNACKAAHDAALVQAITDAKERAQIDAQALIDHERERQEVRTVFVDRVRTITETINANPTGCALPANFRVQLNSAIDTANSKAVTKHGVLPAAPKTGK